MKILHTADWHLGKKLDHYARLPEQHDVLDEICAIADAQAVDVVVVAGDLFDTFNPSIEAAELLYRTLHRLSNGGKRPVIAIAGNHDSPERIQMPDALARICGIIFIGFPKQIITPLKTEGFEITKSDAGFIEIKLVNSPVPLRIIHTPYANEVRLKTYLGAEDKEANLRDTLASHWQDLASQYLDDKGFNLLISHLYFMKKGGEPEEEPEGEHSILHVGGAQAIFSENIPAGVHYVALGHLHRYQTVDKKPCPIVYSSSPLAYSFAEANQVKNVVILHTAAGVLEKYEPIPLQKGRKLLQATFNDTDKAVEWLAANQNALVQLTIEADTYLDATVKKRLYEAHDGLVNIIPQLKNSKSQAEEAVQIDLQKNVTDLFIDYFNYKKGQSPSTEIMEMLKEIMADNQETE